MFFECSLLIKVQFPLIFLSMFKFLLASLLRHPYSKALHSLHRLAPQKDHRLISEDPRNILGKSTSYFKYVT